MSLHLPRASVSYLTKGAAGKLQGICDYLQKVQEAVVIVAEALTKHQAADHIGHGATQEEGWIKRHGWKNQRRRSV